MIITYHADDYGINSDQAERILACDLQNGGALNSVSIMPNSLHLDQTIPMLPKNVKCSIHINLAEGLPCADADQIPLLLKNGTLFHGFLSLLWCSITKPKELEKQVTIEILAQIKSVAKHFDNYKIRIDSHVHYHMIPAVFRALCKAISLSGYEIESIRYPIEKVSLYLKHPGVWKRIRPVNMLKVVVLKCFGLINKMTLKRYGYEKSIGIFFGVFFTGEMYGDHVLAILEEYKRYANRRKRPLEVLFHPGGIFEGEEYLLGCNNAYKNVYSSENRLLEAEMLHRIVKL